MGMTSANKGAAVVDNVRMVLGIELMTAAQAVDLRKGLKPGRALAAVVDAMANAESVVLGVTIDTEKQRVFIENRTVGVPGSPLALAMQGARWYALDDGAHGVEPWVFDGTAFRLVDLVPGPDSSFPRFVGAAHGRVVVEANRPDRSIGLTSIELQPRVGLSPFAPVSGEQPRPCGCEGSPTLGPTMALLLMLAQRRRRTGHLRGTATEARPRCCQ
jgi:ELWxxDGT repeat protein